MAEVSGSRTKGIFGGIFMRKKIFFGGRGRVGRKTSLYFSVSRETSCRCVYAYRSGMRVRLLVRSSDLGSDPYRPFRRCHVFHVKHLIC